MSASRAGLGRHHTVRFNLPDDELRGLTRMDFSRRFILGELKFTPDDINCILQLPMKKGFDVSFCSAWNLRDFWNRYENVKDQFVSFQVEELTDSSEKTVTVRMFNETVKGCDIKIWLARYCSVKADPTKHYDADGIWDCSWRVKVKQLPDPQGYQGLKQIPPVIMLGENRGYINYVGQPKLCRKCGEHGHLVEACKNVVCGKCRKIGHVFDNCPNGRSCNLCGEKTHLFRNCPKSFANIAKNGPRNVSQNGRPNISANVANMVTDDIIHQDPPQSPFSGGEDVGEAGEREESVIPPEGVVEGEVQTRGGAGAERAEPVVMGGHVSDVSSETGSQMSTESSKEEVSRVSESPASNTSLPNAQPGAKRTASELSPQAPGAEEKKGRPGSIEGEPRVFPENSSQNSDSFVSMTTINLMNPITQSTPNDKVHDMRMVERPSGEDAANNLASNDVDVREGLCPQDVFVNFKKGV